MHATFSAINGAFFAYACTYFVGWKAGYEDIVVAWQQRAGRKIEKPVTPAWVKIGPSNVKQISATNINQIVP